MKPNGQNGPEWRVFHDSVERMLGDRTGWLGGRISNLRMAESKSRPPQSHRGAGGSIIPNNYFQLALLLVPTERNLFIEIAQR